MTSAMSRYFKEPLVKILGIKNRIISSPGPKELPLVKMKDLKNKFKKFSIFAAFALQCSPLCTHVLQKS